jgi:hypothetical protein
VFFPQNALGNCCLSRKETALTRTSSLQLSSPSPILPHHQTQPSNLTTATTFASTLPCTLLYRLCHLLKMPPKASKAAADSKSKATTKAMPKSSAKATTKTKTRGVEKKKKGMVISSFNTCEATLS